MIIRVYRKTFIIFICCLAVICILPYFTTPQSQEVSAGASQTDWGLNFQENGKTPRGNASSDCLKKFNSYYAGTPDRKVIYLTFDAGYENGYTEKILDALKKHNVKAAFFLVGHYLEKNPELVKRMAADGHIVGNHTYHHPDMSKLCDQASFQKELSSLEDLYKSITGSDMPKFYRPPAGKFNESNLKQACDLGYKTIFWSLAYRDWYVDKQPSKDEAFGKLMTRIHPGAVVLLHSTSKTNAEILDELLTKWEKAGYTFGTLNELTADNIIKK